MFVIRIEYYFRLKTVLAKMKKIRKDQFSKQYTQDRRFFKVKL